MQNMHLAAPANWPSVCHSQSLSFLLPLPPPFWKADWIWKNHTIYYAGFGAKVTLTMTILIVFNALREKTPACLASLISTSSRVTPHTPVNWIYRGTTLRDTAFGLSRAQDRANGMRCRKIRDW